MRPQPHMLFRDMPDPNALKRNPVPKLSNQKRKVLDVDALVASLNMNDMSPDTSELVDSLASQTAATRRKVIKAFINKIDNMTDTDFANANPLLKSLTGTDIREWCKLCGHPKGWAAVTAACILSRSSC